MNALENVISIGENHRPSPGKLLFSHMQGRIYKFGEFELSTSDGELRTQHSNVRLQDKPLLLLTALLDHPQELVTREQLRKRMWGPDTFVDYEQGINVAIKKIRSSLGDSAEEPKFIQTVAKKGYKFLVPVETVEPTAAIASSDPDPTDVVRPSGNAQKGSHGRQHWWVAAIAIGAAALVSALVYVRELRSIPRRINSIAVLPLQNLSVDPEQDYFADGMTDELITDLAQIHGLRVISRTSIMRYKKTLLPLPQIARELNVDAIVEGTMLRSNNRLRLRVQLIDARTDSHIWAEAYEENERNSLRLQNQVASAIAQHIDSELVMQQNASTEPNEPNFEAYSAYLRGRYEWNQRTPESLRKSIRYFEEAIRLDPNYALAHEGLAETYNVLPDYDVLTPKESFTRAKAEAIRALELDQGLGQAHATLASVKEELDWDWQGADGEFQRSIQLSPSNATAHQWYGEYLQRVGRLEEGVAHMREAQRLDPASPLMNAELGGALYWARHYDEAIVQLTKAIAMEPGFAYAHSWLGFAYEQKGMTGQAIVEFQKAVDLSGGSTGFVAALGHAYGLAGRRLEAQTIIQKLDDLSKKSYVPPYDMAILYTSVGDKEHALRWLEVGYNAHDPAMDMLKMEPALDTLRPDARFQNLVHRVGLPTT